MDDDDASTPSLSGETPQTAEVIQAAPVEVPPELVEHIGQDVAARIQAAPDWIRFRLGREVPQVPLECFVAALYVLAWRIMRAKSGHGKPIGPDVGGRISYAINTAKEIAVSPDHPGAREAMAWFKQRAEAKAESEAAMRASAGSPGQDEPKPPPSPEDVERWNRQATGDDPGVRMGAREQLRRHGLPDPSEPKPTPEQEAEFLEIFKRHIRRGPSAPESTNR